MQNAEFYRNKDDIRKGKEFAASKNLDELAVLCHEQVCSFLGLCYSLTEVIAS